MTDEHITAHLFVAVDENGNWMARGSGRGDEWDRREEVLPPGVAFDGSGMSHLADDDAAIEIVEVVVEIPVPQPKVLVGRLF